MIEFYVLYSGISMCAAIAGSKCPRICRKVGPICVRNLICNELVEAVEDAHKKTLKKIELARSN